MTNRGALTEPLALTRVPLLLLMALAFASALSWDAVASSADGSKLFGTGANNGIYAGRLIPGLSLAKTGGNLAVSWPAMSASAGFILQQTTNLLSPHGWTNYAGTISDDGTNRSASISSPLPAQFFRLKN